jgi:Fic family protein
MADRSKVRTGRGTGHEVAIDFHGHPATAWIPAPLAARDLEVATATARAGERAVAAVQRLGQRIGPALEPLARLLLRAEGVASSNIEGLRAPVEEVALAAAEPAVTSATAAWVADNLAVVDACLAHAATTERLTVAVLHDWHRRLMRHGGLTVDLVGAFRDRQGWIGGVSPQTAAYVPPPAADVGALVDDVVAYVNRPAPDAVAQAAIAHAQFETIHPYGDGNGRIGRLLVLWVLARVLSVPTPPPVSALIARDPGGYLSGLHRFRTEPVDAWVLWFASVVDHAAAASVDWAAEATSLLDGWRAQLTDLRADATARRIVDLLPAHPVISTEVVSQALGVSDTAARTALDLLRSRGIVTDLDVPSTRRGGRRRWWTANDLDALVGAWSG